MVQQQNRPETGLLKSEGQAAGPRAHIEQPQWLSE
jgi:hypothetical protein